MTWTLEVEQPLIPGGPMIQRYRADNGLGLILLRDASEPIAVYQTWFGVGSRHEHTGATGMAHLFEHLMFGRTRTLPPGELDRLIERVGGETNAATWVDWTYYTTSVPAAELELVARIESDRMHQLVLDDDALASEREVVAAERMERVDDDVDGLLAEKLLATAFEHHPYHWPTIGWMDDIRGAAKEEVERFYRTFYAPNNATVVIVGDVDPDDTLAMLTRHYGQLQPSELPPSALAPEPAQTGERRVEVQRPVPADRALIGYKTPAQSHADWAALELVSALLTGGPSSRLYRQLVVDRELASSIDGSVMPTAEPGLYELSLSMMRDVPAEEALAVIDEQVARLAAEPPPPAELAKAKSCVETDFWSALVSLEGKAEALGHYQTALGDFRALLATAERLEAVTAEEITRAAADYLSPERRTVAIARPREES